MTLLRIEIPMLLPSGANLREHWRVRAKRVAAQRGYVKACIRFGHRNSLTQIANCSAALARGEGFNAFVQKGADSDRNTLLKSLDLTTAMLSKSVELRGIYREIKGLTREIGTELAKNGGLETDSTKEATKKLLEH